jgi:hypothetical protein
MVNEEMDDKTENNREVSNEDDVIVTSLEDDTMNENATGEVDNDALTKKVKISPIKFPELNGRVQPYQSAPTTGQLQHANIQQRLDETTSPLPSPPKIKKKRTGTKRRDKKRQKKPTWTNVNKKIVITKGCTKIIIYKNYRQVQ